MSSQKQVQKVIAAVSQRRQRQPPKTRAPLTQEERKEKNEASPQRQSEINDAVQSWLNETFELAALLAAKFDKKQRYFLDQFFQGGTRMVHQQMETNLYNAFKSEKAAELRAVTDAPLGLPTRVFPVGIVVTPTKGLASNIVLELTRMNVSAFAYYRESLAQARHEGRKLADEIKLCAKWQVVCVDPEHLKSKEWREIADSPTFPSKLLYVATDEVHLINKWGVDFRVDFRLIGTFVRGRLPRSVSVVGLSATLAPGKDTAAVCQSLGLFDGRFHMIRRTNERPNIHLALQTLSHGLSGYEFPDLLPFLRSGRKTIVHFHSLPMLFRCYVYIWRLQPRSADKMRRTRMYHSLRPPEYNEETIRRIEEDPECRIILATIAFSNGINAKSLLDSISMGFSSTLDICWQEKGRVGRESGTRARGIVLVQQSTFKIAAKFLKSVSDSMTAQPQKRKGTGKQKKSEMDVAKAGFLMEKHCYIAFLNKHYRNPPLELTSLDCIEAKRKLPCAGNHTRISALTAPTPSTSSSSAGSKKFKLTRKERDTAKKYLVDFRNALRRKEHNRRKFLEHPQTMFLPSSIQTVLLDTMLNITSLSHLKRLVRAWRHSEAHSATLYDVVLEVQRKIRGERDKARAARNAVARRKRAGKRKAAELSEDTDEEFASEMDDIDSDSDLPENISLPAKSTRTQKSAQSNAANACTRTALQTVTNTKRPRRTVAPLSSAAKTAEEYRPQYKPRTRR
ncbi:P-loop containing nucleoside triphosphate hydrolase protein [Mycena leptocephala]|nr:P-loop containing nucleoside triphosphate hydrolase protein [Mycena leptocephala]